MESCAECYRLCDPIPDCLTSLSIITDQPDTELTVRLVNQFNQIFYKNVTTEANGLFLLDLESPPFPPALINPYSGEYKLSVIKDGVTIPFIKDQKEYDCLVFEAATTNPKESTYTIDIYGNETGGY